MSGFDINKAGMIIVGMFVVTWLGAVLIWRFGHIEEKWGSTLRPSDGAMLDGAERSHANIEPRGEIAGPAFGFAAD
jgi:hypothetical protein